MTQKYVVGLTGGIGSGKTTVANLFADQGISLVDADIVARQVVEPNTKGYTAIVEHYGQRILNHDGTINRAQLRSNIFNDESQRQWVNQLLHPLIREEMLKQVGKATSPYVIMVIPLLFENGLDSLVNRTLMVDISPELQVQRTIKRDNVPADQVSNIIAAQMSRDEKLSKTDDVIENQGAVSELKTQVQLFHSKYLNLAKQ